MLRASPAQGASGNHFGTWGYVGFGVGAAGFVTGTILAAATLAKASSIQCTDPTCQQASSDAAGSARDLGLAAIVAYCVSAAGVGVGVADLLLYKPGSSTTTSASRASVRPWIGVGAAGVSGAF